AWAWPLIVDGIIVVATVSVVALAGHRAAWYPWMLLAAGALVSVTANAIHAVIAADADVPQLLAASVAAVPPLVLLAITHLTVILTRPIPSTESTATATYDLLDDANIVSAGVEGDHDDALHALRGMTPELPTTATATSTDAADVPEVSTDSGERDRRAVAAGLRGQGWSNKRIAQHFGVHPSTVGRWLPQPPTEPMEQETSP
ncbi:MAG: helix-turn-helix domain-containing protein, partial [Micrococcaceae bacterium]|nr:helix-turn-helix domain-containing protein [Micrococcaceae bacterium]